MGPSTPTRPLNYSAGRGFVPKIIQISAERISRRSWINQEERKHISVVSSQTLHMEGQARYLSMVLKKGAAKGRGATRGTWRPNKEWLGEEAFSGSLKESAPVSGGVMDLQGGGRG